MEKEVSVKRRKRGGGVTRAEERVVAAGQVMKRNKRAVRLKEVT